MTRSRLLTIPVALLVLAAVAAGCGSSSKPPAAAATGPATTGSSPATTTATGPAAGALTAEAQTKAAGDIPDNQVFLGFRNAAAGYTMRYPEGWLQHGSGQSVTFQDKNNRIRIAASAGPAFTAAFIRADLAALKSANGSFQATAPTSLVLPAGPAFKVSYSTESAPDPVTNKRVTLKVDRYYVSKGGKRAIVDLGAATGVDNVDAYKMIIRSLRWQ
jgi:hypothetical protein